MVALVISVCVLVVLIAAAAVALAATSIHRSGAHRVAESRAGDVLLRTRQWPVVQRSDFDHQADDHPWPTKSVDNEKVSITESIADARYHVRMNAHQQTAWRFPTGGAAVLSAARGFAVSVEVQQVAGSFDGAAGIAFQFDPDLLQGDVGVCRIAGGRVWLGVFHENHWRTLIGWRGSPAIHPGEANKLTVVAWQSRYTVFVNDTYVGDTTTSELQPGQAGLEVAIYRANQQAAFDFDDFEVRAAP